MSLIGILSFVLFCSVMGGLVALYYNDKEKIGAAGLLVALLYLLVFIQLVFALFEFPAVLIDSVVFISMGHQWLAQVIFALILLIITFVFGVPLSKVRLASWKKFFSAHPAKLIVLGVLFMSLLCYTELFNGFYSFESLEAFSNAKDRYEEYDSGIWPTKYIYHYNEEEELEMIALYPFDVTTASGKQDFIYKGETFAAPDENGEEQLWFHPFTWKLYEGSEPVSFADETYIPESQRVVSESDAAVSKTDSGEAKQ